MLRGRYRSVYWTPIDVVLTGTQNTHSNQKRWPLRNHRVSVGRKKPWSAPTVPAATSRETQWGLQMRQQHHNGKLVLARRETRTDMRTWARIFVEVRDSQRHSTEPPEWSVASLGAALKVVWFRKPNERLYITQSRHSTLECGPNWSVRE